MWIDTLKVQNFRNIIDTSFRPGKGLNYFFGPNGAGKTSILETIYFLSRVKTFRSSQSAPLIRSGSESLNIFSKVYKNEHIKRNIGIIKKQNELKIRVDGNNVYRTSDLAREIPVFILTTQSHNLFDFGPSYRRKFMDWGVFHVEHDYQKIYQNYKHALKQRNATLKKGLRNIKYWDQQVISMGQQVEKLRGQYIKNLTPFFIDIVSQFPNLPNIEFTYYKGWAEDVGYELILQRTLADDQKRGYTMFGVHHADFGLKVGAHGISKFASQGQQKLFLCALVLAQAKLLEKKTEIGPILLWDDIAVEFDADNLMRVLCLLRETGYQIFANGTDATLLQNMAASYDREGSMFHVEQGAVTKINP